MQPIMENEQWKLDANCSKCRRRNYCSTPCTHKKRRDASELKRLVAGAFVKLGYKKLDEYRKSKE